MGYFDALTSSSFKTREDGQRLFFPWGTLGRGYRVDSEERFQQLRRQVKAYLVISLPLTIAAVLWLELPGALAAVAVLTVGYTIWALAQCRQLTRTDDRLTLGESVATQAREHNVVVLWLLLLGSLLFVALGVFIVVVEPEKWVLALACVVFFGAAAVMGARMLMIRRRTR